MNHWSGEVRTHLRGGSDRREIQNELPWSWALRVKEDWWSLSGLDRDQIRVICCGVKRKGGRGGGRGGEEEGGKERRREGRRDGERRREGRRDRERRRKERGGRIEEEGRGRED